MRIIVLDEEFPLPLNTGKRIRTYNLISRLAKRHEIRYLAYGEGNSESYEALHQAGIQPYAVPSQIPEKSGLYFYFRLAKNLLSPLPYIVDSHYSRLYAEALASLLNQSKPDILLSEWSPYAIFGRPHSAIKQVIVAHNVESHIWRRYAENETNPAKRWYIQKQHAKVAKFEQDAFLAADGATAVSKKEADELQAMNPRLKVQVVDNGVDFDYFAPKIETAASPTLVFTGSMDWRPNQDAAEFFAQEILPILKRTHPDLQAVFVGRNPPEYIQALGKISGMQITGTVDDVRPYISKAAVYIVPLRIGGGSRLKILEAMSMEKAVVSTTVGAEGLEIENNTHLRLADTPETFAQAVNQLIADRQTAIQLGKAGRQLVIDRYGWDSLSKTLEQFLQGIAGR